MTKFKELINCLCTEEMIDMCTAPIVYYKGMAGYLVAYDMGLGFTWLSKNDDDGIEHELNEYELSHTLIMNNENEKSDDTYIGSRTPIIANGELYEFGYHTNNGCVVYRIGEFSNKHPYYFSLDQIHVPNKQEFDEIKKKSSKIKEDDETLGDNMTGKWEDLTL